LALGRELGDSYSIALSLNSLGVAASRQGDPVQARALLEEALALYRGLGDKQGIADTLQDMGEAASQQGDDARAAALLEESLALYRELGDRRGIAASINNLGNVLYQQGAHGRARALFEEGLLLSRDIGAQDLGENALEALTRVAGAQGQARQAALLGGAAEALREALGTPLPPDERAGHASAVQVARTALGEERFAAAWAEGRALPLEEAIALALEGPAVIE
jgi:tetratricopeptide (TPR) repeat protein